MAARIARIGASPTLNTLPTAVKMGARALKRAVQNVVEAELATAILEGRVKRGDTVQAGVKNEKITFTVKN